MVDAEILCLIEGLQSILRLTMDAIRRCACAREGLSRALVP
jgi:hypothetical protein